MDLCKVTNSSVLLHKGAHLNFCKWYCSLLGTERKWPLLFTRLSKAFYPLLMDIEEGVASLKFAANVKLDAYV